MMRANMRFVGFFWILLSSTMLALAQNHKTLDPVLDAKIPHFEMKDGDILDGLSSLSSQDIAFTLGFERVLKPKRSDPPTPESIFSLKLENATVREILNALCDRSARYAWLQDGASINVFPKTKMGDDRYLLNRRLSRLEMTNITSADAALGPLVDQLPPPKEQIAIMQVGGAISYPQSWSATLENVTVRQALNRIAAQLGPKGGWIFSGSDEFRFFTFFTGPFHKVGRAAGH